MANENAGSGVLGTLNALANPVGTAVGAVGSIFNYMADLRNQKAASEMAKYNTDATIKAQKDAADLAYQRNLEQWNRENAYNSPVANMQRLRSAGLNPMLVYGTGSVGANSAATSPQMATINPEFKYQARQIPHLDPLSVAMTAQQVAMGRAQLDQVRAQTALTLEEKKIRSVEALMAGMRNLPMEYQSNLRRMLGESMSALAKGTLDTGSLSSDLAFRQGMVSNQRAELALKLNENNLFPLRKALLEGDLKKLPLDIALKRIGLDLQRQEYESGKIKLNQQSKGIDHAPWVVKGISQTLQNHGGAIKNWLSKYVFDKRLWLGKSFLH